jgi:aarF domain-containing kinase
MSSALQPLFYPATSAGLSTEAVLVETFEPGRSVAEFIRAPHPHNTQIVSLGLDCFLKQLLEDNFVHTDLHPGNILVRTAQHGGSNGSSSNSGNNGDAGGGREDPSRVELVLLDFGLAEELTPAVRRHFISFLHMISRGDGRRAAEHLLQWSVNQRCPDPEAFTAALVEMFREKCDIHSEAGIDVDAVLKGVLHLARHHEVSIDSNYAALVVGVCVIVGFATSLDRRVNLMDAATPVFLYHALTGRVSGRLYM